MVVELRLGAQVRVDHLADSGRAVCDQAASTVTVSQDHDDDYDGERGFGGQC